MRPMLFTDKILYILISFFITHSLFCAENEISKETCFTCHSNIDQKNYVDSVHGGFLCISCHSDIVAIPHQEKLKTPNCSTCHDSVSNIYNSSDHGKKSGATCLDCHGDAHAILNNQNPNTATFRTNIPKLCASCHSDEQTMERYNLLKKFPVRSYLETVHGKAIDKGKSAVCTDCHGYHNLQSPTNPDSKIYRLNVSSTCGKCHEKVLNEYKNSVHGKAALSGKWEAPVCTDCHGEHTIRSHDDPASALHPTAISEKICASCHAAEKIITKYNLPDDRVQTYFESYHGLANKYGTGTVANCASCHGSHDILPSSDPNSSINKKNLPKTCGQCHPNVSDQLAKGSVHVKAGFEKNRILYFVRIFYITLIILVIGAMILHNGLDFWKKFKRHYKEKRKAANYTRFTFNERLQHFILAFSFIILAYTGFALRYSDAWWTFPFNALELGIDWRGDIHKFTAIIFVTLCSYHLFYILFTKKGNRQLKDMLPRKIDFLDCIGTLKHNMSLPSKNFKLATYNYIEKIEYWAVIWGSLIMAITGFLMTFESFTMRYFPKWIIDLATLIHYYEAVLACLAILFWHLYFVIFDPRHYPLNLSMITGLDAKREKNEDKDDRKK